MFFTSTHGRELQNCKKVSTLIPTTTCARYRMCLIFHQPRTLLRVVIQRIQCASTASKALPIEFRFLVCRATTQLQGLICTNVHTVKVFHSVEPLIFRQFASLGCDLKAALLVCRQYSTSVLEIGDVGSALCQRILSGKLSE